MLIAAAAFGTKGIDAAAVKSLGVRQRHCKTREDMLKGEAQGTRGEVLSCGMRQFEQTMAATARSSTPLKVRLDTLRAELTREKDAAILSLKQAQDSQLEELNEYLHVALRVREGQRDAEVDRRGRDAKIEEFEAALWVIPCPCGVLGHWARKEATRCSRSRRRRSRRRTRSRLAFAVV